MGTYQSLKVSARRQSIDQGTKRSLIIGMQMGIRLIKYEDLGLKKSDVCQDLGGLECWGSGRIREEEGVLRKLEVRLKMFSSVFSLNVSWIDIPSKIDCMS